MSLTGSRPPYPSNPPQYRGQPPTRAAPPAPRAMHARQPDREWAAPPRHTGAARLRQRRLRPLVPWLFLAPALILFLYFKIMPLLQGVKMSFYDVRPYLGDRYVGWGNYVETTTQPQFTRAIWQTVVLAVGTTAGSILLGFLLAILVEGQARHLWLVRTAAFLPVVTTMAVVAEVWQVMYYPDKGGALNTILGWIGVGPEPFLRSPDQAMPSVILVGIWRGAPYDMMIFLALLAALRGLRSFTEVFLLTSGGPAGRTQVIMVLIYELGLEEGKLGVAAAGSMILFVATAAVTIAVYVWRRRAVI